jgi:hypothetical protein
MIENYAIVRDTDIQNLVNGVMAATREGFQPLGGIAMVREVTKEKHAVTVYAQAMILVGPGRPLNGKPALLMPDKRVHA